MGSALVTGADLKKWGFQKKNFSSDMNFLINPSYMCLGDGAEPKFDSYPDRIFGFIM